MWTSHSILIEPCPGLANRGSITPSYSDISHLNDETVLKFSVSQNCFPLLSTEGLPQITILERWRLCNKSINLLRISYRRRCTRKYAKCFARVIWGEDTFRFRAACQTCSNSSSVTRIMEEKGYSNNSYLLVETDDRRCDLPNLNAVQTLQCTSYRPLCTYGMIHKQQSIAQVQPPKPLALQARRRHLHSTF